jgi:tetracycline repressor-like protein
VLTHWIWPTVECSAPTRGRNATKTIVVSSTAATPPMISAVSTWDVLQTDGWHGFTFAQFQDLALSPAELRRELVGGRESSMEVIVPRAIARGELGSKTPPARVISLPVDLLRHELLMTLEPAAPGSASGLTGRTIALARV